MLICKLHLRCAYNPSITISNGGWLQMSVASQDRIGPMDGGLTALRREGDGKKERERDKLS